MRTIILALLLAGCIATPSGQTSMAEIWPAYERKPIDTVVARWGAPQRTFSADGVLFYEWNDGACKVQAQASESRNLIGFAAKGNEASCAAWFGRLK